ncbi:MAG: emp24p/erv25p- protein [Heterodermia speciosa]|uniref:Emp24p/erv25p- protein n=1 Tax=Heterodermia speciosa TaxID=116794 RepID=A0A8H3I967_9LECA|nr:MAG: emp24p/erv25p- protein [Heterodermia speciosa]
MEISQLQLQWLLQSLVLMLFLDLAIPVSAVYFYIENAAPKCFYEELPKDTIVVGHYKAEQFDPATSHFAANNDLSISVTVDETFDNDHRVVSTKGGSTGKFTFSAADSGDHRICFTPSHPGAGGWLSGGFPTGGIKMTLDLAIGETSQIESTDKGKISEIVQKVKDLNARLLDIRREQAFQRVSYLRSQVPCLQSRQADVPTF